MLRISKCLSFNFNTMNRFFGVIFIMLATIGATYSQVYENVYENSNSEVRAKLDQNKIQGIDILTGVFAQHNIKLSAIDNNGKTELTNLLNENNQVKTFTIDKKLKSLTLITTAHITKEYITDLLKSLSVNLNEYTVVYSIEE